MTAERWQEVQKVLGEALLLGEGERAAYLEEACGGDGRLREEVESLLAHASKAETAWETPVLGSAVTRAVRDDVFAGKAIGPYRIEKLLGQGGMGSVYLAKREVDGFGMAVALKVIRTGPGGEYAQKRFRMERQILARLTHPNITRLLDGGVTPDGLPYLVMEYIEGQPLHQWLRGRRPGLEERLRIFQQVCSAVGYAHRNLVVHGDIKPNNIMVMADGTPKLLDFGIARLMNPEDSDSHGDQQTTLTAMTPAWASPEQLRGERASTAGDSYALGLVLYFLLTGSQAYEVKGLTPVQITGMLERRLIKRPSEAAGDHKISGDLDNIALKALEYDPERRYATPQDLAEDIHRHLESMPVLARPQTRWYRLGKFLRRHRTLAAGTAAVAVALVGGSVTTLWQARIAQRERARAEQRFADVRRLASTFLFETDDALAKMAGATALRAEVMRNAVEYLDGLAKEATNDPALQEDLAVAYERVGDIQGRPSTPNLGQTAAALESYRKAERIREALAAQGGRKALTALSATQVRIGSVLKVAGDYRNGLEYDRKAVAVREKLLAVEPQSTELMRSLAGSYTALGGSLSQLGDWAGVLEARRKSVELYERLLNASPESTADRRGLALAYSRMGGVLLLDKKKMAEALPYYRRALAIQQQLHEEAPTEAQTTASLGQMHTLLGSALAELKQFGEALEHFAAGRKQYESLVTADAKDVRARSLLATNRARTARSLLEDNRAGDAIAHTQASLDMRRRLSAESPLNVGAQGEVAESLSLLGEAKMKLGQRAEAQKALTEAMGIFNHMLLRGPLNMASQSEMERVRSHMAKLNPAGGQNP